MKRSRNLVRRTWSVRFLDTRRVVKSFFLRICHCSVYIPISFNCFHVLWSSNNYFSNNTHGERTWSLRLPNITPTSCSGQLSHIENPKSEPFTQNALINLKLAIFLQWLVIYPILELLLRLSGAPWLPDLPECSERLRMWYYPIASLGWFSWVEEMFIGILSPLGSLHAVVGYLIGSISGASSYSLRVGWRYSYNLIQRKFLKSSQESSTVIFVNI